MDRPGGRSLVEDDVVSAGVQLTSSDFEAALSEARASYSESIGAPKIPNVSWDDVGGLASVKRDILDTIQLPLEHPELFADGLKKRSGMHRCNEYCVPILLMAKVMSSIYDRYSSIRPTGHRQDPACKSSCHVMLPQLLLHQRPRASEHVHRRIRGQRPTGLSAGQGRQAMCNLFRRVRLCRA